MKKKYIIPEVNTYKISVHQLVAESPTGFYDQKANESGGRLSNENYFDDEHDPWWRR